MQCELLQRYQVLEGLCFPSPRVSWPGSAVGLGWLWGRGCLPGTAEPVAWCMGVQTGTAGPGCPLEMSLSLPWLHSQQ